MNRMTEISRYRAAFDTNPLFLNFGSYGPPSRTVVDTSARLLDLTSSGTPTALETLMAEIPRAVGEVARLTGFSESGITLMPNTSTGLLSAALGIPGGTVLVGAGEFPANQYPWRRAAELGRATVRWIGGVGTTITPELVADSLTPDVVALSVSAVDFRTGFRADLAGLRAVLGDRLLIVDGIQGVGVVDNHWEHADVLLAGGQKWLRSGWGTGFMALSTRAMAGLDRTVAGWTGVAASGHYDGREHAPLEGANSFAITNLSPIAFGAFAAGVELVNATGVANIAAEIAGLHTTFLHAIADSAVTVLSPTAAEDRAALCVVSVPGYSGTRLAAILAAEGITATGHEPDRLRISIHASTTEESLLRVAEVLRGL